MPCLLATVPRTMFPPPSTRPRFTPSEWTALTSSARRSTTVKSIPVPRSPASDSPDSLTRTRRNAKPSTSVAPERESREPADGDLLAHLARDGLDQVTHLLLVVLHERLLQQHPLLVEFLELALGHLLLHRRRLARLLGLLEVDRLFAGHDLGRDAVRRHRERIGGRDVHGH